MRRLSLFCLLALIVFVASTLQAQSSNAELVQISPPTIRRAPPPSATATLDELEKRGDELRVEKDYLDSLDYYRAVLAKNPNNAEVHNKAGIAELLMQRYKEAGKEFEHAVHLDHSYADAVNNLGCNRLMRRRNLGRPSQSQYEKALKSRARFCPRSDSMAGAAYFGKKWSLKKPPKPHATVPLSSIPTSWTALRIMGSRSSYRLPESDPGTL